MHIVLDKSEDQPHFDPWPDLHPLKAPRLKEHVNLRAPCTQEQAPRENHPTRVLLRP